MSVQATGERPNPQILGVVHLPPLPGTPFFDDEKFRAGSAAARQSVEALVDGGADGALVQTADRVYDLDAPPDPMRVALLTRLMSELRAAHPAGFRLGVQVMRNGVEESLAIAKATGCDFVRATALIGATLSASGWVTPNAAQIMQYRTRIQANGIHLYADIASVHNTWADDDLPQVAARAVVAGADGVVVGLPDIGRTVRHLEGLRKANPDLVVVLAGHANFDNAATLFPLVDAAFVSGVLSPGGWNEPMDATLVARLVTIARAAGRNE